jgi:archaellum component FlaC
MKNRRLEREADGVSNIIIDLISEINSLEDEIQNLEEKVERLEDELTDLKA